jgi:hypothetical protein
MMPPTWIYFVTLKSPPDELKRTTTNFFMTVYLVMISHW